MTIGEKDTAKRYELEIQLRDRGYEDQDIIDFKIEQALGLTTVRRLEARSMSIKGDNSGDD